MNASPTLVNAMKRFERMSLRERVLIAAAFLAIVLVLWNALLMQPLANRQKALLAELDSLNENMNAASGALESAVALDPTNVATTQLNTTRTELAAVNKELATMSAGLIPPERMTEVIYDVLRHQQAVTLISLRNEPRQSLVATVKVETQQADSKPASGDDNDADAHAAEMNKDAALKLANSGPFMHPVELVIEGRYLDILAYTRALEALPWRFYWHRLDLQTTAYPLNRVRIELSTLSLDEAWLGV